MTRGRPVSHGDLVPLRLRELLTQELETFLDVVHAQAVAGPWMRGEEVAASEGDVELVVAFHGRLLVVRETLTRDKAFVHNYLRSVTHLEVVHDPAVVSGQIHDEYALGLPHGLDEVIVVPKEPPHAPQVWVR
jgi:hypothetical protein